MMTEREQKKLRDVANIVGKTLEREFESVRVVSSIRDDRMYILVNGESQEDSDYFIEINAITEGVPQDV